VVLLIVGLHPGEVLPVFAPTEAAETNPPSEETIPVFAPTETNTTEPTYQEENEESTELSPFNVFSFYIPANSHLYEAFQQERPELSPDQVVWMVNAHLHLPFFEVIIINEYPNPLLVNTFYRLPDGFVPAELVPVNNATDHLLATPETVDAFRALRAEAQANNFSLSVTSAYRTAGRQYELWSGRGYVDGSTARPHHSEHQTGRALDLWGPGGLLDASGPTATGGWVAQNAHYFGFIMRYRADTTHITGYIHEPWHITYVGLEISMYMYENNILSLEEFVGRNPDRRSMP